jgi:hypothetical protein
MTKEWCDAQRKRAQQDWLKTYAEVDHTRYKDLDITKMSGQEIYIYAAYVEADHRQDPVDREYSENAYIYAAQHLGHDPETEWHIYDFYSPRPFIYDLEDRIKKARGYPRVLDLS